MSPDRRLPARQNTIRTDGAGIQCARGEDGADPQQPAAVPAVQASSRDAKRPGGVR